MSVSLHELEEINCDSSCARFVHTNLHLHSPTTSWDWDAQPNQTLRASEITPNKYFKELNRTSLELVAITDHNCVDWCIPLMELAVDGRKRGTSKLHILPGVEITTYEGPHIIAVFGEESTIVSEIQSLLIRLGMSGKGLQQDRVSINSSTVMTIKDVITEIVRLNGIVIGPHIHSKDGLWGHKDFRARNEILNDPRLRILAAPSEDIKRVEESPGRVRLLYKNMDANVITNSFAFVNISDCHRLDDFEIYTTWMKMSSPSLDGIKQIIFEPELRIGHSLINTGQLVQYPLAFQFSKPENVVHPHIIGMTIEGGMLDGLKVCFSPHQNSIIGKNYAGKTALLDCLRFALNAFPSDECDDHYKFTNRLKGILGDGNQVRIYIHGKDGKYNAVSRTFSSTKVRKDTYVIEGQPDVYILWQDEFQLDTDLNIENIFPIEVYPQGEVVRIKDNVSQQLKIVDSLACINDNIRFLINEEVNGERTSLGTLRTNSEEIIELSSEISRLSDEIRGIDDLKNEIQALEEIADSPLLAEAKAWGDVENSINKYKGFFTNLSDRLNFDLIDEINENDVLIDIRETRAVGNEEIPDHNKFDPENAAASEYLAEIEKNVLLAILELNANMKICSGVMNDVHLKLDNLSDSRQKRWDKIKDKIDRELKSQGLDAQTELVQRISEKRSRLSELEGKISQTQEKEKRLTRLKNERIKSLDKYYEAWEIIHEARQQVVSMINANSARSVQAELIEEADYSEFRTLLEEVSNDLVSQTNRIQSKGSQLDLIAELATPTQLIEVVKGNDANKLLELVSGITENTARILVGMGLIHIHRFETCILHDRFLIKLRKEGDDFYTPIDAGLSGGEQALALVSVAMIGKEMPLVIDQPEDELGPALITNELVEQIRMVKSNRQLIFVTHIANIPVLADSEQVLYLQQETTSNGSKKSILKHQGSLDNRDIVSCLLELDGGKIAFQKRSERYSCIIKSGVL